MTWMLTINGREHELAGPNMINNESTAGEIAHALSMINRFTGHTKRPYSVAEHSLLVADLARMAGASLIVQRAALMHDAHEAFTSDLSSPAKWAIGDAWTNFEHAQASSLHNQFSMRAVMHSARAQIREWDLVALATERRDLTSYDTAIHRPWLILDHPEHLVRPSPHHKLNTGERAVMTWHDWRDEFMQTYFILTDQIDRVGTEVAT